MEVGGTWPRSLEGQEKPISKHVNHLISRIGLIKQPDGEMTLEIHAPSRIQRGQCSRAADPCQGGCGNGLGGTPWGGEACCPGLSFSIYQGGLHTGNGARVLGACGLGQ